MSHIEVLRYAAFTDDPAGGNPAGVVLDASDLDDARMLAIAAEIGYSETAFLTPSGARGEYALRYFSPLAQVPFCGHATVAGAVAVADRCGAGALTFHTPVGPVPVEVVEGADGIRRATLTSVAPRVYDVADGDLDEALAALGWSAGELDPGLPPRVAYAGARHLVLAAGTRRRLAELRYDFDRLAALMTRRDWTTLQLVWRESADRFHARDPFPVGGVVEDPATGAAAAAFGGYLRELGIVGPAARVALLQGYDLGRPSRIDVELRDGEAGVRVTGAGVAIPA